MGLPCRGAPLSRLLSLSLGLLPACAAQSEATAEPPVKGPWDGSAQDQGNADTSTESSSDASAPEASADVVAEQTCMPKTCAQLGAECGSALDGCGASVTCGTCPAGQNCGGNGPNKCGAGTCTPKTCTQMGASCGLVSDGCGLTLSCGVCTAPQTCGGAGVSNQCGCSPTTCAAQQAQCGPLADGCGVTLQCGNCQYGTCQSNQCSCSPTSCAAEGAQCGSMPDGCGGTLSCGSCPYGTCQANKCQCTPTTCAAQGALCGSIPNGCGGSLSCGLCQGNQSCSSGQCGCPGGQHVCGVNCITNGTCCSDSDCSGLTVCSTPGASCACRTSPSRQAVYRSYAYWTGDHFLSTNQWEGPGAGYQDEGVRFYDYPSPCQWGLVPFYRLSNPNAGEHFYTGSSSERDALVAAGWTPEGDIGCIADGPVCGSVALYRLAGSMHMYTTDEGERDALVSQGWWLEGTAGYVWLSP